MSRVIETQWLRAKVLESYNIARFKSWFCHLVTVWPWTCYSACASVSICKKGTIRTYFMGLQELYGNTFKKFSNLAQRKYSINVSCYYYSIFLIWFPHFSSGWTQCPNPVSSMSDWPSKVPTELIFWISTLPCSFHSQNHCPHPTLPTAQSEHLTAWQGPIMTRSLTVLISHHCPHWALGSSNPQLLTSLEPRRRLYLDCLLRPIAWRSNRHFFNTQLKSHLLWDGGPP